MITQTIQFFYPGWKPPRDNGRKWVQCLCPFHGEETASAAVSYQLDAFNCFACPVKGDAYSIIQHVKGGTFEEAKRFAEEVITAGSDGVSRTDAGLSGGGTPEGSGIVRGRPVRTRRKVSPRVRRRPSTGF